jgi:hypothetical protein
MKFATIPWPRLNNGPHSEETILVEMCSTHNTTYSEDTPLQTHYPYECKMHPLECMVSRTYDLHSLLEVKLS